MKDWKSKLKQRLPVVILLLMTILFWSFYDRYQEIEPPLLNSPELAEAIRVTGASSKPKEHFILSVPEGGKTASVSFRIPSATDYNLIRIRGRLKVDRVVTGKYAWRCARIMMTQRDGENRWIPGKHGVASETGTQSWESHEEVFEIFSKTVFAELVIQQIGRSGTAYFDQLIVEPVKLRGSFPFWRIIFVLLWLSMGGLYFRRCRLHQRKLKVLIFLNVIAILVGTLVPNLWIQTIAERGKEAIHSMRTPPSPPPSAINPKPDLKQKPISKSASLQKQMDWFSSLNVESHQAGHFFLFASLCFLVYCSAALERQHISYFFKVGVDVLLFAAVSESLQYLTFDRSAGISDLMIDLYGMGLAFLIFLLVLPVLRRFTAKLA